MSGLAIGLLICGACFAAVTIVAGIAGLFLGVGIFGGMPAPSAPFMMPEVNPKYLVPNPPHLDRGTDQ